MNFDRTESAKWGQAVSTVTDKLVDDVEKALAESAGRGFPMPPGATLQEILAAGQTAKGKLCEANGKIYDERRATLFQQEEFEIKIIVQLAKLAMELYRAELLNALEIEAAENAALRDTGRADVERMNAETDKRQVSIIRDRAEMERRITVYKAQLVAAEAVTMTSERALIEAQLATATKKLEIIDSIYQVLAAEELVLVAENRRAATLEDLLTAQRIVAEIKEAMIPFYQEKAKARGDLAVAITQEIPISKAIVELGYDRIAVKNAEEAANHQVREAEEELELVRMAYVRANAATTLAREMGRGTIQGAANEVKTAVMLAKKYFEMAGIDLKLITSFAHKVIEWENTVAVALHEAETVTSQIGSIAANLSNRASSEADKVVASADTQTFMSTGATSIRRISGS